jgi:serine/threonine protein kinase
VKALIFPFSEQETLTQYLDSRPFNSTIRLSIAMNIIDAVDILHKAGFVVGGLNIDAIVVRQSGTFGPYAVLQGLERMSSAGNYPDAWNAVGYRAPDEHCRIEADVFAIGSVLSQLQSEKELTVFQLTANQTRVWEATDDEEEIPESVSLFERCWVRSPCLRPTIDEVKEGLSRNWMRSSSF